MNRNEMLTKLATECATWSDVISLAVSLNVNKHNVPTHDEWTAERKRLTAISTLNDALVIKRTRQYLIQKIKGCIEDANNGIVTVNDPVTYKESNQKLISDIQAGLCDHSLAFVQCAQWIKTGSDFPILL